MRIPALRLVHVVLMTGSPHLGQSIGIYVFRCVDGRGMDQPQQLPFIPASRGLVFAGSPACCRGRSPQRSVDGGKDRICVLQALHQLRQKVEMSLALSGFDHPKSLLMKLLPLLTVRRLDGLGRLSVVANRSSCKIGGFESGDLSGSACHLP